MAQRVQVILVDDVSGGDATETVEFALDGVTYEIDLNDENATRLREDLAPWIGQARRSGGRRQTRRRGSSTSSGPSEDLSKIREWGRENGYKVSSRGRVSQELRDAYAAAN
ncbi:histone-like nucleoid-structuring protein Lsr2 [Ornithinimicrobium pratense]|uniref:Lsr2 family protein n=1 Tax=Ornithinimicrobium pratense TaxID=2593973 RepID=A0A5J6V1W2_9MICO|nr:Lsr2 family protein [Ornithinimicrobium pratense]QFG67627.1 Lsr2 family protein [Ornithinimicrobium pratense]